MNKQIDNKAIEEMAKMIGENSWEGITRPECYVCAEELYNAGYRDQKEIAAAVLMAAIQLSGNCRTVYEFQNRLFDLITTSYGIKVETKTIIPAEKYGVEVE